MVLHFKDNNDFDLVPECISYLVGIPLIHMANKYITEYTGFMDWLTNFNPLEPFVTEDITLTRTGKFVCGLTVITMIISIFSIVTTSLLATTFMDIILHYDTVNFVEIQASLALANEFAVLPVFVVFVWLGLLMIFLISYIVAFVALVIVLEMFKVSLNWQIVYHLLLFGIMVTHGLLPYVNPGMV